jgi:hypothetical protein
MGRRHQKGTTARGTDPRAVTRISTTTSRNAPANYQPSGGVRIDTEVLIPSPGGQVYGEVNFVSRG